MNKIKVIESVDDQGMESLLNEVVTFFCCRYFYTGKLTGVDSEFVLIEDPKIIYDTGSFSESDWADAQPLPHKEWRIRVASIESYGVMK